MKEELLREFISIYKLPLCQSKPDYEGDIFDPIEQAQKRAKEFMIDSWMKEHRREQLKTKVLQKTALSYELSK